jgi:hypothetical protein
MANKQESEEQNNPEASFAGTAVHHIQNRNIQIGNKILGHGAHHLGKAYMFRSLPVYEGKLIRVG